MKKVITLDFSECCYLGEVYEVIRRGLELPEWFGANPDALWFPTAAEAMSAIRAAFTAGTAVLVKASHAMNFGQIVKELETTE